VEESSVCLFFFILLLGPRVGIIMWSILEPARWESAYDSFFWPLLGFIFLPWTTLMFVAVAPFGNVDGWDWFWLGLAVLADVFALSGGGYTNRSRIPSYGSYA
jgi:hypothetical protein